MWFRVVIMSIAAVSSIGVSASICDVASAHTWRKPMKGLVHGGKWMERQRRGGEIWCNENSRTCNAGGAVIVGGGWWLYDHWPPDDRQPSSGPHKIEPYTILVPGGFPPPF